MIVNETDFKYSVGGVNDQMTAISIPTKLTVFAVTSDLHNNAKIASKIGTGHQLLVLAGDITNMG